MQKLDTINIVICCVVKYELYLYTVIYILTRLAKYVDRLQFIVGIDFNNKPLTKKVKYIKELKQLTKGKIDISKVRTKLPRSSKSHGIILNKMIRRSTDLFPNSTYTLMIDTDVMILEPNWDTLLIDHLNSNHLDAIITDYNHSNFLTLFKTESIMNLPLLPPKDKSGHIDYGSPSVQFKPQIVSPNNTLEELRQFFPKFPDENKSTTMREIYQIPSSVRDEDIKSVYLDTTYLFQFYLWFNKKKYQSMIKNENTPLAFRADALSASWLFNNKLFVTHRYASSKRGMDHNWIIQIAKYIQKHHQIDMSELIKFVKKK